MTTPSEYVETQLERTSLAWDRTGFATAGAGLVLARVAALRGAWITVAVSLSFALIAVGPLLEAGHHSEPRLRWLAGEWRGSGLSGLARATTLAVCGLSGAGLLLVLTT